MANITEEDLAEKGYNVTSTANKYNPYDPKPFCNVYPVKKSAAIRPSYYGGMHNKYEVFNVLEAWGLDKDFYLGNVIKYVARAGKKNKSTEREDLLKAIVYLQKRIDTL
jgi:hypothetical protein